MKLVPEMSKMIMLNDNGSNIWEYDQLHSITFIHYGMSGTTFGCPVVLAFVYLV